MPVKEKKLTGKQIARVLEKARKLMNNNGKHWKKNEYECKLDDGSYAYCARGAIRASILKTYPSYVSDEERTNIESWEEYTPSYSPVEETRVVRVLQKAIKTSNIETWNDRNKRTWEDVDEAFRKAAELARESG